LSSLDTRDAYYWATHGGAELDLLVFAQGKRYGFEFKHADAPGTSRSMRSAIEDLHLERLWVVYPGTVEYPLDQRVTVVPLEPAVRIAAALRDGPTDRTDRTDRRTGRTDGRDGPSL